MNPRIAAYPDLASLLEEYFPNLAVLVPDLIADVEFLVVHGFLLPNRLMARHISNLIRLLFVLRPLPHVLGCSAIHVSLYARLNRFVYLILRHDMCSFAFVSTLTATIRTFCVYAIPAQYLFL